MKIFVYEHLCAGKMQSRTSAALLAEGRAMLTAVLADLTQLDDVAVVAAWAQEASPPTFPRAAFVRPEGDLAAFLARSAAGADAVLAIAPEIDGVAAWVARCVEAAGGRLLGPDATLISLFADKLETARKLGGGCIPCYRVNDPTPDAARFVVKPRDGVGALFTFVGRKKEVPRMIGRIRKEGFAGELIVQAYHPGSAASIGVLGRGRLPAVLLPAAAQDVVFAPDQVDPSLERVSYIGGRMPLAPGLDARVQRLAAAALGILPPITGYFGIDVILGCGDDGAGDRVVEINPRLTTAYVGYSRLLAGRMGRLLLGRETDEDLNFLDARPFRTDWKFAADGRLTPC